MLPESSLRRLADELTPGAEVKSRLKGRIEQRIVVPHLLAEARRYVEPDQVLHRTILERVLTRISSQSTLSFLEKIRSLLTPTPDFSEILKQRVLRRLQPQPAYAFHHNRRYHRGLRMGAFAAVFLTVIRIVPLLFLPSYTIAESPVTIMPTRGEVSVLIGGLWQPVKDEVTITKSALVQTDDGEATIVAHDDYVLRLSPHTTVAIHDLSDRPAPASHDPTLTLHNGRIWVQGFVPSFVEDAIAVATVQGNVLITEGSVSVEQQSDIVEVGVWNRRAEVVRNDIAIPILSGERLQLWEGNVPSAETIAAEDYEQQGVVQNLKKDAVHQREIAHLQQERRAQAAGILPTSPLYPAKRVAEAVDMLLTFGEEQRTMKRLNQANTRLNEAVALLGEGSDTKKATKSLEEYRETLLAVSTGTGGDIAMQSVLEASADMAAALPDDELYAIKETVLETSASLTGSTMSVADVQKVLVADTVSDIALKAVEGKDDKVKEALSELEPLLLEGESTLSADVKEEVTAALSVVATTLASDDEKDTGSGTLLDEVSQYLPRQPTPAVLLEMTEEQMDQYVQAAYDRIFLYSQQRSRWNQLLQEFRALEGHPNRGSLLRRLYHILPEDGLARYVRTEIQKVREEVESE